MSLRGNPTKYTSQGMDNSSFDDTLGVSMVEIIGADGVLKNPATEETQLLVKSAIENITIPAPVGGATEAKQDVALSLIPWLKTILAKIATPAWYDPTANVIRNQVQSGTITTVTTVTTCGSVTNVANLTNVDGYQGKMQIINQNNAAWASVVRARIS